MASLSEAAERVRACVCFDPLPDSLLTSPQTHSTPRLRPSTLTCRNVRIATSNSSPWNSRASTYACITRRAVSSRSPR
jgi:hypothetical protein